MKKYILLIGALLSLSSLAAQAEDLVIYSIQRPEHFFHTQDQNWKVLYQPPQHVSNIQLSNRGKIIYEDTHNYHWYALDPRSGQSQLIAKSDWFKGSFLHVLPVQRSDGGYYAKAIQRYSSEIYLVNSKGKQSFLKVAGLYDFVPLADGSYAYVIWNGRGNESNDFSDYIPGQKMQLWHKPLSGKARLLGSFDTVHDLRAVGQSLLFFMPGQKSGRQSWQLMAYDLAAKATHQLADIPKSRSRGTPELISWPNSDWIVYPPAMPNPDQDHMPHALVRQQVSTAVSYPLGTQSAFMVNKGQGQAGYVTGIQYGPAGSEAHTLISMDLNSGQIVQRVPYRWREIAPGWAAYLP